MTLCADNKVSPKRGASEFVSKFRPEITVGVADHQQVAAHHRQTELRAAVAAIDMTPGCGTIFIPLLVARRSRRWAGAFDGGFDHGGLATSHNLAVLFSLVAARAPVGGRMSRRRQNRCGR